MIYHLNKISNVIIMIKFRSTMVRSAYYSVFGLVIFITTDQSRCAIKYKRTNYTSIVRHRYSRVYLVERNNILDLILYNIQ